MTTIGFFLKRNQPIITQFTAELIRQLQLACSDCCEIIFSQGNYQEATQIASQLNLAVPLKILPPEELMHHAKYLAVIGGDGTLLHAAKFLKIKEVPLIGINMGRLGFLTEIKKDEAFGVLRDICQGAIPQFHEHRLIEVALFREGILLHQSLAVNEAVVSKGALSRLVDLELRVDGHFVSKVRADGLIVSTPTGSTAYALSAGGPIIDTQVRALLIAPINPHALTLRPLVVSDEAHIEVRVLEETDPVYLTLDGQNILEVAQGDLIAVKAAVDPAVLRSVRFKARDYFHILKEKLKFGYHA
jgi:NAD+ kinase